MAQSGTSIQNVIRLVVVALLAIACFFAVKALMIWFNPSSEWQAPRAVSASTANSGAGQAELKIDYDFDPFHPDQDVVAVETPVDTGEDAPDTTLNLTLKGFISPDRAIIQGTDRKDANYGVGDEVTRGVTIGSIYPENKYVILNRDGVREKLMMEQSSNAILGNDKPMAQRQNKAAPKATANLNPLQVLDSLSFQSVSNNNRLIGYRIKSAPGVDLKAMGFRNGDVLTKIGGQDLTSPGIDLKKSIMDAVVGGNATAQIMRRGRKITIRVKMP